MNLSSDRQKRGAGRAAAARRDIDSELRESNELLQSLLRLSTDFFWETDAQHRFTRFDRPLTQTPAFPPDGQLGKTSWEFARVRPDEAGWRSHREMLERHLAFRDFECARLMPDGTERDYRITGEPMFADDGSFRGYRGVGRDITQRKRAQQLLALEHAVARCLADADNVVEGLKAVIRAICETENWECGRYFRLDEEAVVLRFGEFWVVPGSAIERFIDASREVAYCSGEGLVGRVWQTGQPLWSADTTNDSRVLRAALARDSGIHGAFVFPVTSVGKVIGVLTFNSREVREPDERLLQAIGVLGSQIGQFLKRKQAEEGLRTSEARFRSLTILSSDTYWEQDEQYRFTSITGSGKEWIDATRRKALGKRRWEMEYLNMTAADWTAHIAIHDAHQPYHDLKLCRMEAGKQIWISVSGEPVFDEFGAFKGYRGVGKDITDRMLAEHELREREERFRRLTGLMSDGYWELDEDLRFTFVSAGIEEAHFAGEELLGRAPWECGGMQASPEEWRVLRENLKARRPFHEFVFSHPWPGGALRYFSISGLPINDAAGRFQGYQGLARDITEKALTQEHLQYLAYHDGLTGLRSRSFFVEALGRAIAQARRAGRHLAVLFIDLDDFKRINDTYGHPAGDQVLKQIAGRLMASFRKGDLIARFGGDEFVVLIEDTADRLLLQSVANKALAQVVKPCAFDGREMRVTASLGIGVYPEDAEDENDLIRNADAAMYGAKHQGKNTIGFFSATIPRAGIPRGAPEERDP